MHRSLHQRLRFDRRRGFTLVELLVVVAIVGILASLMLPAIQQAREASRLAACQSNLRQIGVALQAYHQSHASLPIGCIEPQFDPRRLDRKNFAWSSMLLPYLEQGNVWLNIDFKIPSYLGTNADVGKTDLWIYRCPSSDFRGPLHSGRSDYGGLYGQRITTNTQTDNGVFIYDVPIRFIDVLDGLTNTMAVAEDVLSPDPQWINGRNIFEQAWGVNDPASILRAPDGKILMIDNEIHSDHRGGATSVFVCGRFQFLSNSIDRQVLASHITRGGGEVLVDGEP